MELVHALNRGVDKRQMFMDDHDHLRFAYGLLIFNDQKRVDIASLRQKGLTMSFLAPDTPRKRLVDIHGWCLMGNHYHLLLSACVEGGISKFLAKLNIGYAKYFNERYTRSGTLFQGRTKQVRIATDSHFLHILHYIHLNPLDFLRGSEEWRSGNIQHSNDSLEYLTKYRWSSYHDYCNRPTYPAVITTDLFSDVFKQYETAISAHLKDMDSATLSVYALD